MGKGSFKYFQVEGEIYNFKKPQPSGREAKKYIREFLKVKKLPSGIKYW